jgi:hypothetical protein
MTFKGFLWEATAADFLIVTLLLGGLAAYMTGRAVAAAWEPAWLAAAWMVPLGAAVRFIHFAFFHGTLLSVQFFVVDVVVLVLIALFGHRLSRTNRVTVGYPWMIARKGPLSWRLRDDRK